MLQALQTPFHKCDFIFWGVGGYTQNINMMILIFSKDLHRASSDRGGHGKLYCCYRREGIQVTTIIILIIIIIIIIDIIIIIIIIIIINAITIIVQSRYSEEAKLS